MDSLVYFNKFLNSSNEYDVAKVKAHANFLNLTLPYIAALRVRKNAEGKYTFQSLVEDMQGYKYSGENITLATGEAMTYGQLAALFRLFANHSRSDYIELAQSKVPSLSVGVPLVLAAFKIHKGIKYEDWDWTSPVKGVTGAILGKGLEFITDYVHNMEGREYMNNLPELREQARKSAKGTVLNTKTIYLAKTEDNEFNSLPKNLKFMLLQWWIWHPAVRHENMIMDLSNLDNMPEPLEASKVNEVVMELPW